MARHAARRPRTRQERLRVTLTVLASVLVVAVGLGILVANGSHNSAKASSGPLRPTPSTSSTTTIPPFQRIPPGPPTDQRTMTLVRTIGGDISPKSVDASDTGLVFAQNMMYRHTMTVYDSSGNLVTTIPDTVNLAALGVAGGATVQGAPVEAAFTPDARDVYVSNYSMYGPGQGPEGNDSCTPASAKGAGDTPSYLYRVNTASLKVDQVIQVGLVPKYVAVTPDGRYVLVANWCSWDLDIIDTTQAKVVADLPMGPYPRGIAISPDSSTAYGHHGRLDRHQDRPPDADRTRVLHRRLQPAPSRHGPGRALPLCLAQLTRRGGEGGPHQRSGRGHGAHRGRVPVPRNLHRRPLALRGQLPIELGDEAACERPLGDPDDRHRDPSHRYHLRRVHRRRLGRRLQRPDPGLRRPVATPAGGDRPAARAYRLGIEHNQPNSRYPRQEIEEAFQHLWSVGAAGEDWDTQAELYTEDCVYFDHYYGTMDREQFRRWCNDLMQVQFPELYTVYQWHVVDGDTVVALMLNRRDNPDPNGPPTIDFPSISFFRYGGEGRWAEERDFWNMQEAVDARRRYREACARFDPEHPTRRSRLHWPEEPFWARPSSASGER